MRRRHTETGTIKKDWGGRTPVAIVYPNTYYIGMSNLAIHLLYSLLNADPGIVAERVFLPENGEPLSEESGRPLSDFRAAMFTFSFEADYLNIPKLFGKNIELHREKRGERDPLLIAGGPAVTMNPEALSGIFDVIFVGEVEDVIGDIVEIIKETVEKGDMIGKLAQLHSVIATEPERGILRGAQNNNERRARDDSGSFHGYNRAHTKNLNNYLTHSVIWTDETEFGHMHMVEVARGCPWMCKFCATPSVYSPYRTRSSNAIWRSIEHGLPHRRHVGLIGSDVLGHPDFMKIATELIDRGVKVSTSSLRVNRITKEIASILSRSGHRRATLGIEAGTERLRKLIDKDLTDAAIFRAVKNLAHAGITNLKLYFMIGLPDENEDDIWGISDLTKEIRKIILSERKSKTLAPNISLVITPFVPKLPTPFTDKPFAGVDYLKGVLKLLKAQINKIPNTRITGESPKQAGLEYLLSHTGLEAIHNLSKNGL